MSQIITPEHLYYAADTSDVISGWDIAISCSLVIGAIIMLVAIVYNFRNVHTGRVGSLVNKLNQANLKRGPRKFVIFQMIYWILVGVVLMFADYQASLGWWMLISPIVGAHIFTTYRVGSKG